MSSVPSPESVPDLAQDLLESLKPVICVRCDIRIFPASWAVAGPDGPEHQYCAAAREGAAGLAETPPEPCGSPITYIKEGGGTWDGACRLPAGHEEAHSDA